MNLWVRTYRRLDLTQRGLWFRVAAAAIALAVCGFIFGHIIVHAVNLDRQWNSIVRSLSDEASNRAAAASLRASGTITIDGRTYGNAQWQPRAESFIDPATGLIPPQRSLLESMLADQKPAWIPLFLLENPQTAWIVAAVVLVWLQLVIWMGVTLQLALTSLATGAAVALCWWAGSERWMLAFAGIGLLTFTFVLLTRLTLFLLQFPAHPLAVAHTVVKEASRLRISLVFIVLLLVGLPIIPMVMLDPQAPLRFRIQTFLSSSMHWTYGTAAIMTLLLACATVAFEIRDRQIWQLLTKPLARFTYLFGKWLGVVSVNLVILLVSGVSIFVYTQYLRHLPVAPGREGQMDRLAVRDQILTARVGMRPVYDPLTDAQLRTRMDQRVERDPELALKAREDKLTMGHWRSLAAEIQKEHLRILRVVPPFDLERQTGERTYEFSGLSAARAMKSTLTLKYRFYIGDSSEHERYPVRFVFNDDPRQFIQAEYTPTVTDSRSLVPELIRDDGTLKVTILNLPSMEHGPKSLSFEEADFELLYRADTFEMNFLRALMASWVKLAFLAMLGIAAATFLSFPVACLLSFTIFLAATLGPYLAISLNEYYPTPTSQMQWNSVGAVIAWLFESIVRGFAQVIVFALHSFGDISPTTDLVEGRLISWKAVGRALLEIGLLWSGIALAVGALVFSRRELATYSGQG